MIKILLRHSHRSKVSVKVNLVKNAVFYRWYKITNFNQQFCVSYKKWIIICLRHIIWHQIIFLCYCFNESFCFLFIDTYNNLEILWDQKIRLNQIVVFWNTVHKLSAQIFFLANSIDVGWGQPNLTELWKFKVGLSLICCLYYSYFHTPEKQLVCNRIILSSISIISTKFHCGKIHRHSIIWAVLEHYLGLRIFSIICIVITKVIRNSARSA
jgi:hypothetical protein